MAATSEAPGVVLVRHDGPLRSDSERVTEPGVAAETGGTAFRSVLLVAVSVLVLAVLSLSMLAAAMVFERSARTTLDTALAAADRVAVESWSSRALTLRSEARVVAEEPRLKAVASAEDVSRETIVAVVTEIAQAVGAELFVLTDEKGCLVVDVADPRAEGQELGGQDVVATALVRGDSSGIWISKGDVYQVQAIRLDFGETPFGALIVGRKLGSAFVESLARQTASEAVLELDGAPLVVSRSASSHDKAALSKALATLPAGSQEHEVQVGGERYLALANALPGYSGGHKLRRVLLRSLDEALSPARRLRWLLALIAVGMLCVAAIAVHRLSLGLSRPLESLAGFTRELGAGRLDIAAEPSGPRETRMLAHSLNRMAQDLAGARESLRRRDRLERELEIAERIQTAMLPRHLEVPGLEIGARMQPMSEVGGDYYDVLPAEQCCWIGIGNVAGHGLTAGLVMMMIQSGVTALVRAEPMASPRRLVGLLNDLVVSNVRGRLGKDEHVTFALLRYANGILRYAGAHEEIVIYRASSRRCERIEMHGVWLGLVDDAESLTEEREIALDPGDLLVLYTDGLVEAMDPARVLYGLGRLTRVVERHADEPVQSVCDRVLEDVASHCPTPRDDRTIVVIRRAA